MSSIWPDVANPHRKGSANCVRSGKKQETSLISIDIKAGSKASKKTHLNDVIVQQQQRFHRSVQTGADKAETRSTLGLSQKSAHR